MIQELSYRKRIQSIDILTMESVASCNTTIQKSTPKETIEQLKILFSKIELPPRYKITKESLKSLYDHSFDDDIDFAALSVITEILDNGIVLSHWGKAHKIKDETSVIAAPIEINNERYYAVLISGKKKDGFRYPYAIRVFSDVFIKDELLKIYRTSTQGSNTSHQNADFQKFAANLLINYILTNSDLSFLTDEAHNKADIAQNISVDKDGNYVATYGHGADFVSENNRLNCNRNMNKKLIRLTESDLHRIVRESVNKVLNEIGDTKRGQNLLGQVHARAGERGDFKTMLDTLDRQSKEDDSNYVRGLYDRLDMIKNPDTTSKEGRRTRLKMQNNYDVAEMEDMDALGRKFIDFIEKHHGGALLQTIVDYESGNETGIQCSAFPTIVPEFEEAVLGYKCTPKMRKALKRAYTHWWHYAQDELMTDEEY